MGILLSILNMALDVNLFQEEVGGQGEAWGELRLFQASIFRVMAVFPPPTFTNPPTSSGLLGLGYKDLSTFD